MDARSEQKSLSCDPLPEQELNSPLTSIWEYDRQIAELQERMDDINRLKKDAMEYVITHKIEEEGKFRLEHKIRKTRVLEIERFKRVFPKEYDRICDIQRDEINKSLEHVGKSINIGLLDEMIGKTELSAAQGVISIKEDISYKVVRKHDK